MLGMKYEPDTRQLVEDDKGAQNEVDGAHGFGAGGCRQRHAALSKQNYECVLPLPNVVSNLPMEDEDKQAERQASELDRHRADLTAAQGSSQWGEVLNSTIALTFSAFSNQL